MKKIVRLTESDLVKLVKRVISEQTSQVDLAISSCFNKHAQKAGFSGPIPPACVSLGNEILAGKSNTSFDSGMAKSFVACKTATSKQLVESFAVCVEFGNV